MEAVIEGIVLAAGLSTRMGVPKVLLEIDGVPLVFRVVRAAIESTLRSIILVVDAGKIHMMDRLPGCAQSRVRIVVNPNPETGMSSSLKLGLAAVDPASAGAMILLADQPLITKEVIDHLLDVFEAHGQSIVLPTIGGRRTTPVIFPSCLLSELMEVTGDVGGREVIKRREDMVLSVEMGSRYDDTDLDTPEDFEALSGRIRRQSGFEK